MKRINMFDLWVRNWENASRFFESKGNATTRSKLKDKWHKEFTDDLKLVEKTVTENLTKHNSRSKKDCYNDKCENYCMYCGCTIKHANPCDKRKRSPS